MAKGFVYSLIQLIKRLFNRKPTTKVRKQETPVYDPLGSRGHYFDGNGAQGYNYRSSQRKRRKMARRTGG